MVLNLRQLNFFSLKPTLSCKKKAQPLELIVIKNEIKSRGRKSAVITKIEIETSKERFIKYLNPCKLSGFKWRIGSPSESSTEISPKRISKRSGRIFISDPASSQRSRKF